jgi:hypothetical protein
MNPDSKQNRDSKLLIYALTLRIRQDEELRLSHPSDRQELLALALVSELEPEQVPESECFHPDCGLPVQRLHLLCPRNRRMHRQLLLA